MVPHRVTLALPALLLLFIQTQVFAQQRKAPTGGRLAVVVDERLAALRSTPQLTGQLVRRLGRGRLVAIRSAKTGSDGVTFLFVNVTGRTRGWIQRESVASPSRVGDDVRLLRLIQNSNGFDRIARARIFLEHFRRSALRPRVLLLLGDTTEDLAAKISAAATRKLTATRASGDAPLEAPEFTYYLNYTGLDRYNRVGVHFLFNPSTKRLHYDGHAFRLLLRLYPNSPEADEARQRLLRVPQQYP